MTCLCYSVFLSALLLVVIQNDPRLHLLFSKTVQSAENSRPRYDYAASDPGGKILGHSRDLFGARGILKPDKDKYLVVPCSQSEKWVEISLLEDILIDEVQFVQGEIYSSDFRSIEILYSIDYPTESWQHLVNVELEPGPYPQRFKVESAWVRFLKVVFLSHYGNEYYCTLTQFSVYGSTILQNLSEDYLKQREETIAAVKNLTFTEDQDQLLIEGQDFYQGLRENILLKTKPTCKPSISYYNLTCDNEQEEEGEGVGEEGHLEVFEKNKELKAYFNVFGEMVKHMAKTEIKIEQVFYYCHKMEKLQKNFDEKFRLLEKHFALLELQVLETQGNIENLKYWLGFFTVLFGIGMLLAVYITVKTRKKQEVVQAPVPRYRRQNQSLSETLDDSFARKTPIHHLRKKHTK